MKAIQQKLNHKEGLLYLSNLRGLIQSKRKNVYHTASQAKLKGEKSLNQKTSIHKFTSFSSHHDTNGTSAAYQNKKITFEFYSKANIRNPKKKNIKTHESRNSRPKYFITDIQQGATERGGKGKKWQRTLAGCERG